MIFKLFSKWSKKKAQIQPEYIDLLKAAMESPLWNGSDEQLYQSFPRDLTPETITYVRDQIAANSK